MSSPVYELTADPKHPSFIRRFLHVQGEQEAPYEFFVWSAISLVAACLGNRVWFEKFRGSRLLPNLYTMLIGPSGLGKGVAIDAATRFVSEPGHWTNLYRGKATHAHLIDYLSNSRNEGRMYLVTPELSMSVGSGPLADCFVKLLTELFTGGDYTFQEGTRTSGKRQIQAPVVNWLGGTTEDWLVSSITKDAISGGFFARVVPVIGQYDFMRRIHEPSYPEDHAEQMDWLERRVRYFCTVDGKAKISARANHILRHWYETRPVPEDDLLLPTWKREHDLVLKLAMLLMVQEKPKTLLIRERHVVMAQQLIRPCVRHVPHLVTLASVTPERDAILFISRLIQTADQLDMYSIYGQAARRGITKGRVDEVIGTLLAGRHIQALNEKGRTRVQWARRRHAL